MTSQKSRDHARPSLDFDISFLLDFFRSSNRITRAKDTKWLQNKKVIGVLKQWKRDEIDNVSRYQFLQTWLGTKSDLWDLYAADYLAGLVASLDGETLDAKGGTELERLAYRWVAVLRLLNEAHPLPGTESKGKKHDDKPGVSLKEKRGQYRAQVCLLLTALKDLQEHPEKGYFAVNLGGRIVTPWDTPTVTTAAKYKRLRRGLRPAPDRVEVPPTYQESQAEHVETVPAYDSTGQDDEKSGSGLFVTPDKLQTLTDSIATALHDHVLGKRARRLNEREPNYTSPPKAAAVVEYTQRELGKGTSRCQDAAMMVNGAEGERYTYDGFRMTKEGFLFTPGALETYRSHVRRMETLESMVTQQQKQIKDLCAEVKELRSTK